ncbi:hypothetical protein Palpr_2134 [Paludibacter propionicigenes WB4]|uniref:Uncharacterized protein n=1 Tax=Paludibacter propionicigenes (strain DSM 17365 / JCM 13257 / WB4) TaxID=694427 RepID=E4T6C6_PALPW|nr:hypothetical protein [Paludibacter propionicigenes]ADQ80270.1 hypothetical protein Palpr_2134 [Paludibacter propionicigenes WB4]
MSYTVIDKKAEHHSFGVWPVKINVDTTLTLVKQENDHLGISYDCVFSGVKSGHVQGGPIQVDGDMTKVVNDNPKVLVIISGYQKTAAYASMHVKITVDAPVIGTITIFDSTLGGNIPAGNAWELIAEGMKAELNAK